MDQIQALYDSIRALRDGRGDATPRTRKLVAASLSKKAQKVGEEAVELVIEAISGSDRHAIEESADLIYNMVVLWEEIGLSPEDVWEEMRRRRDLLGIAEKLPKRCAA